jgi:hypothetical protein
MGGASKKLMSVNYYFFYPSSSMTGIKQDIMPIQSPIPTLPYRFKIFTFLRFHLKASILISTFAL